MLRARDAFISQAPRNHYYYLHYNSPSPLIFRVILRRISYDIVKRYPTAEMIDRSQLWRTPTTQDLGVFGVREQQLEMQFGTSSLWLPPPLHRYAELPMSKVPYWNMSLQSLDPRHISTVLRNQH